MVAASCGKPKEAPQIAEPTSSRAADQADLVRANARLQKRLSGECSTDTECDAAVTDADLAEAKQMLTEVMGTSTTGNKSDRAPSTYFENLHGWSCGGNKNQCAAAWFDAFRADMYRAVKEGDDSDDPWVIPKDQSEVTADTPFTHQDLVTANVPWEAVDNMWMCRSAIIYRRWRAGGDRTTTKADLAEALRDCFKVVH